MQVVTVLAVIRTQIPPETKYPLAHTEHKVLLEQVKQLLLHAEHVPVTVAKYPERHK